MKWFKHDSDANRDPKLEKVLMKYGAEGYALYWLCIELIAAPIDKHNITFELEHDAEILAHRLKMDSARVEEIMRYMGGLNLFEIDPLTQRVTCMKLALRIENSIVKHPELKQIQQDITSSRTIPDNPGKVRPDIDIDTDIDTEIEKEINQEAWREFVAHRKEIKSPMTSLAEKKQKNILRKLSPEEQRKVIDKSIANGWKGLFPEEKKVEISRARPL